MSTICSIPPPLDKQGLLVVSLRPAFNGLLQELFRIYSALDNRDFKFVFLTRSGSQPAVCFV